MAGLYDIENTAGVHQCNHANHSVGLHAIPGYALFAVGCVTYALGPILQKLAHRRELPNPSRCQEEGLSGLGDQQVPAQSTSDRVDFSANNVTNVSNELVSVTNLVSPIEEQGVVDSGNGDGVVAREGISPGGCGETIKDVDPHSIIPKRPWLWVFGVVIYMGSGILWAVSFLFVPISRVQPLLAITVVLNFVFAWAFLGEPFTRRDKFLTIPLLIMSVVLAALFAPENDAVKSFEIPKFSHNGVFVPEQRDCVILNDDGVFHCRYNITAGDFVKNVLPPSETCDVTMDAFRELSIAPYFLTFSLFAIGLVIFFWVFSKVLEFEETSGSRKLGGWKEMLLMLTYGIGSGCSGGLASASISLWESQLIVAGNNGCTEPFEVPIFYFAFAIMIWLEVGQIYFINKGISRFPVMCITTLEVISNSLAGGLAGTIAFGGMECFEEVPLFPVLYSIGLCLAVAGCMVLVDGHMRQLRAPDERKSVKQAQEPSTGISRERTNINSVGRPATFVA
mmetsp:Transcript_21800/g.49314  ORF Transcript_21800/g.49314 Transcript_21800/m.49314 type:complete len:508 (-) Transcript_21800:155-1678(-)